MVLASAWGFFGGGRMSVYMGWVVVIAALKCNIFKCNFFQFVCVGGCVGGGGNGS